MVQQMQAAELSVIHFVPLWLDGAAATEEQLHACPAHCSLIHVLNTVWKYPRQLEAVGGSVASSCSDSHMQVLESP